MARFKIVLTDNATRNIDQYIDFITLNYSAPLTALRHYQGLFDTIYSLQLIADSIPFVSNSFIIHSFGFGAKRINYKRMTIIFKIQNNTVIVLAVVPQANIKAD